MVLESLLDQAAPGDLGRETVRVAEEGSDAARVGHQDGQSGAQGFQSDQPEALRLRGHDHHVGRPHVGQDLVPVVGERFDRDVRAGDVLQPFPYLLQDLGSGTTDGEPDVEALLAESADHERGVVGALLRGVGAADEQHVAGPLPVPGQEPLLFEGHSGDDRGDPGEVVARIGGDEPTGLVLQHRTDAQDHVGGGGHAAFDALELHLQVRTVRHSGECAGHHVDGVDERRVRIQLVAYPQRRGTGVAAVPDDGVHAGRQFLAVVVELFLLASAGVVLPGADQVDAVAGGVRRHLVSHPDEDFVAGFGEPLGEVPVDGHDAALVGVPFGAVEEETHTEPAVVPLGQPRLSLDVLLPDRLVVGDRCFVQALPVGAEQPLTFLEVGSPRCLVTAQRVTSLPRGACVRACGPACPGGSSESRATPGPRVRRPVPRRSGER